MGFFLKSAGIINPGDPLLEIPAIYLRSSALNMPLARRRIESLLGSYGLSLLVRGR